MFSVFPELLFLAPLAALLLRIAASVLFILAGLYHARRGEYGWLKALAVLEFVIGGLLLVGLYTQPAALVGALLCILWRASAHIRPTPNITIFLLFFICFSLILTGAGPISFDLPL